MDCLAWVLALLVCGTWCQGTRIRMAFRQCFPAMPESEYTVASEVVCAVIAHLTRRLGYSYTSPTCSVFGPQMETEDDLTIFVPPQTPLGSGDIALEKPTNSSGYMFGLSPSLAVDGKDHTMYHSLVPHPEHWWVVDFLGFYSVTSVLVLPRPGIYAERFFNIEVRIGQTPPSDGDFSSWHLFHLYAGPYSDTEGRLNFTATEANCGRFLSIQRLPTETTPSLNIMDVKVFAKRP